MLLATSALFAQQTSVKPQLRSQGKTKHSQTFAAKPELRKSHGVVRVGKGERTVHVEVKQANRVVNYVPVNLSPDLQKDGTLIKFNFVDQGRGRISLSNVSSM